MFIDALSGFLLLKNNARKNALSVRFFHFIITTFIYNAIFLT